MARADALKPPIFLLGNVRSGTSMTMFSFDLHPEICVWNEPRTVWVYADPARRHDHFTEEDATPRVVRYIRGRFLRYQRRHGGQRVMEKTPSNVMRARYVHAIFPESKLLYIIRDPLANLSSSEFWWRKRVGWTQILNRLNEVPKTQIHHYAGRFMSDKVVRTFLPDRKMSVWGVRYPGIYDDIGRLSTEEVIAKQWVACARQADEDLDHIDEELVLRVRYEEFVTAPVETFQRVLDHFGERMTDEIAARLSEMIDPGRRMKWTRLDPEVLRRCVPILRDEMARQGYEIPDEVRAVLAGGAPEGSASAPSPAPAEDAAQRP